MARRRTRRTRRETSDITVKVARTGGTVKEVLLAEGATVEEALTAAEIEYGDNSRIRVAGESVELDTELEDGDYVTVSGKVKGGK